MKKNLILLFLLTFLVGNAYQVSFAGVEPSFDDSQIFSLPADKSSSWERHVSTSENGLDFADAKHYTDCQVPQRRPIPHQQIPFRVPITDLFLPSAVPQEQPGAPVKPFLKLYISFYLPIRAGPVLPAENRF